MRRPGDGDASSARLRAACWLLAARPADPGAGTGPSPRPAASPRTTATLTRTISYAEMETFLQRVDGKGPVTRLRRRGRRRRALGLPGARDAAAATPSFRILFYAQQHGDEVSGKDALLYLLRDIARDPELLPADVDLWVMPMMNPDGAEARHAPQRAPAPTSTATTSLLEQPETQALHRVARRAAAAPRRRLPRVHARLRGAAASAGWIAWPDITMDGLNNPLFDPAVVAAAERWVDESGGAEAAAGHPFLRYSVGGAAAGRGAAPLGPGHRRRPQRASACTAASPSSSRRRSAAAATTRRPTSAKRVDAYLVLFRRFLDGDGHRAGGPRGGRGARGGGPLPRVHPDQLPLGQPGRHGHRLPGPRGRRRAGRSEDPDRRT